MTSNWRPGSWSPDPPVSASGPGQPHPPTPPSGATRGRSTASQRAKPARQTSANATLPGGTPKQRLKIETDRDQRVIAFISRPICARPSTNQVKMQSRILFSPSCAIDRTGLDCTPRQPKTASDVLSGQFSSVTSDSNYQTVHHPVAFLKMEYGKPAELPNKAAFFPAKALESFVDWCKVVRLPNCL